MSSMSTNVYCKESPLDVTENIMHDVYDDEQCSMHYDMDDGGYNSFMMEINEGCFSNAVDEAADNKEIQSTEIMEKEERDIDGTDRDTTSKIIVEECSAEQEHTPSVKEDSYNDQKSSDKPITECTTNNEGTDTVLIVNKETEQNFSDSFPVPHDPANTSYNASLFANADFDDNSFVNHCIMSIPSGSKCSTPFNDVVTYNPNISRTGNETSDKLLSKGGETPMCSTQKESRILNTTPINPTVSEKCKGFVAGSSIHPESHEAITPMPDYSMFPTPQLKVCFTCNILNTFL